MKVLNKSLYLKYFNVEVQVGIGKPAHGLHVVTCNLENEVICKIEIIEHWYNTYQKFQYLR